jgi:acyl dehydratase
MLYFEDIEPGTKAAFGRYEVTREEVIEFASKYDPQPFHLSDEEAAKTHFGKLAARRWLTPVYPGDILRIETEVLDKRPSRSRADMGSFRSKATVFNQDDVAVMSVISIGLVRRRPEPD